MSGTLPAPVEPVDHDSRDPGSPLAAFRRLDVLLARALAAAQITFGLEVSGDAFRGLYVSAEQASRCLERSAGAPLLGLPVEGVAPIVQPSWPEILANHPGWSWLRDSYGLSDRELDAVLVALSPEIDLRYERLYGHLQEDVNRRRPTVNLVLDLLSESVEDKLDGRRMFASGSALIEGRVLRLTPDPQAAAPPLLAHVVTVDQQVVDIVCRRDGLDDRLASWCQLSRPASAEDETVPLDPPRWRSLVAAARAAGPREPLRLNFHGPAGSGRRVAAEQLAAGLEVPLLAADLLRAPARPEEFDDAMAVVFREATLHGALLYLNGAADRLDGSVGGAALEARLGGRQLGVVVVAGRWPWVPSESTPLGVVDVSFCAPGFRTRRRAWQQGLMTRRVCLPAAELDVLADRFRFGPGPIANAIATAGSAAALRGAPAGPEASDLFAAARDQTAQRLTSLTRRVPIGRGWDQLVLPGDAITALHEICERVMLGRTVWQQWGFERAVSGGTGVCALFTGPSGTGKTMAAGVIAHELGLDLFAIDLSSVVSKYIGETEKNLERIFAAATDSNAVLFFDEADALFGKRTKVQDAHDRYANIETSYLLQRLDSYDGVAILATNLRQNFDDALTRRLHYIVNFPWPGPEQRRRLWELSFPAAAPLAPDLDPASLAQRYQLSGASIRNVALQAAFLAAGEGRSIGPEQVRRALEREYQKIGQVLDEPPDPADGGQ